VNQPGLHVAGVSHRYGKGPLVLDNIDFFVASGETVALMGPSGSGKTTLLSIMGLLTKPVSGSVAVDGVRLHRRGRRLDAERTELFSWVFQTVNVLGQRTATDNAALGLLARGVPRYRAAQQANRALAAVGLADRIHDEVTELSGGELQRVCIARAMAAVPRFVLADEPTGQLDHATSQLVLDSLWEARCPDTSLVIATHDLMVAKRCDRVMRLVDGRTVAEDSQ
jgi:ABC-type lipoprotein export system ATPase subunit